MRPNNDQKRKMLEEVIIQHESIMKVAQKYGLNKRTLRRLVDRARKHGIDSVLHNSKNRHYSDSFRLEVVRFIEDGGSYSQAGVKFNINHCMARAWYLGYSSNGADALLDTRKGRPPLKKKEAECTVAIPEDDELSRLKARNAELERKLRRAEMENEFLKKLDALVRERIERERKR